MAGKISFIHTADLHLDSPFKGLENTPEHIFKEIKESTFHALDKLVDVAISKQVDFILIVGDLFDNEKQSLKAQIKLRRAFEELKRHEIQVYVSYGNHDFINGNVHAVTYPDNVHIFTSETVDYFTFEREQEKLVHIYGFSYENRAVTVEKSKEYKIVDEDIPYHIAMLHGSIRSNTEHDVYAPFQLSDLIEEDYDYWALGHIHKRQVLKEENPTIIYPGNIQGRNRKEVGIKGCYYVELTEADIALDFVPVQRILFQQLEMDLTDCKTLHDAEVKISKAMMSERVEGRTLIDLSITGDSTLSEWEKAGDLDELIDIINETIAYDTEWRFIFRVTTHMTNRWMEEDLKLGDHFIGEIMRQAENINILESMSELSHHKRLRRHIQPISLEDEQRVKEEAKALLLHELLKG